MELSYWRSKWRKGKTGFHMQDGYPGLEKNWNSIEIDNKAVVLVPLCGKSKDLIWLSQHCKTVIGVEISEIAIQEFMSENNLEASSSVSGVFTIYHTGNIQIWNGDFFKLPIQKLPPLDLIYDKAALNALPPEMRNEYASKILESVSTHTKILLHLLEYKQEEMTGPPFSVSVKQAKELFRNKFEFKILERAKLDINNYKKFQNRGLRSYFIEILSLLLPKHAK